MTAKPLIRIVDDDEALTASSAMLLEAMGWDVAVWHSGGAFLDEADLMRPGCLVLDPRPTTQPRTKSAGALTG